VKETLIQVTIRPFEEHDYPAAIALSNAIYPDYPFSEEEWRHFDARYDGERLKLWRVVVEEPGGQMIGSAEYHHSYDTFHPQKFVIEGVVHPNHQGRGLGSRLYNVLMAELAPLRPIVLWVNTRETFAHSIRFLEQRGFVEKRRAWESRLSVAAFDPTPFEAKAAKALQGFSVTTVAGAQKTRDWLPKVYDLHREVLADVPRVDEHTPPTIEEYEERWIKNPDYIPGGHFLAVDGNQYVAESNLFRSQELPDVLYQGITGTRRAYRNRGLALGLKLRTVAYARANGIREIRTWNDTLNAPMLSVNVRMGFVRQPAWISFEKRLAEEA
jgi:GNAT superfamily N-acetyltransferase